MNLNISTSTLRIGLSRVADATNSSKDLPILSNVLLEASNNTLTLTGTNLDQMASVKLPCEAKETLRTTLPCTRLATIVGGLAGESVSLEISNTHVAKIISGSSLFSLPGLPPTDFPNNLFPATSEARSWKFDAKTLRQIFVQLSPMQSTEASRYVLNGVYFLAEETGTTWVATNGRALMFVLTENDGPTGSAILPSDFIRQAIKALDEETTVTLSLSENSVRLDGEEFTLTSKLIEGNYPSYKQIIPTEHLGSIVLPREEFLAKVRQVSNTGPDSNGYCLIDLVGTKNNLDLSVVHEKGAGHESLGIKLGEPFNARLNRVFIDAALRNLAENEVRLEYGGELNPFVFNAGNVTSVIMGARVKP